MALTPDDPLARAREAARNERPEGWPEVADSAMARVRAFVTPSVPLTAYAPDGGTEHDERGSTTRVASRLVRSVLRTTLQTSTHTPERLDLVVDDGRLAGVEVLLVVSYGTDLRELTREVHAAVRDVVRDLLGPDPAFADDDVVVRVVDVVVGDPRRQ